MHISNRYRAAEYFAVSNLYYPNNDEHKHKCNSIETNLLVYSIIDALKLNSQAGVDTEETYILRNPYHPDHIDYIGTESGSYSVGNYTTIGAISHTCCFNHLTADQSILLKSDYDNLSVTIDFLISNHYDSQFIRLLSLALDYYYFSFNNEKTSHSFLFLMIICDTLFKKIKEESSDASSRISKFLSIDRTKRKYFRKIFYNDKDSFYNIRNMIAHGNIDITREEISLKYKMLFPIVRNILVKFVTSLINDIEVNNYYESLDLLLNQKEFK